MFSKKFSTYRTVHTVNFKTMRFALSVVLLLLVVNTYCGAVRIITDLLQYNLAGHPTLHQQIDWPFDPEVGVRRSRLYQEINGVYGEKAIERLGLGIDGHDQERLAKQRERDQGHLGGLNDFNP